jgi:hypothetical protein
MRYINTMTGKRRFGLHLTDGAIVCGLIALIVFAHLTLSDRPASATGLRPLLLQGEGMSYGITVNENAGQTEYNARYALLQIGSAEAAYASSHSSGQFAWLHELHSSGYIPPNQTGRTIITGYSIAFYLPQGKHGFTLIAEPLDFAYRPFMLTENQEVVLLTPSVQSDPTESWETVRTMESEARQDGGLYDYFAGLQLFNYNPPLQVRLDIDRARYVLHSFIELDSGYKLDESLVYYEPYVSYMVGDTRPVE